MKWKSILLAGALALTSIGCTRNHTFGNNEREVAFSQPHVVQMPSKASYAEKRSFADFTGDGIEDMAEVSDTAWIGQNYKANIYPGEYNKDGILTFSNNMYTVNLPLDKSWMSDQTKLDSADVNGDGFADFVFTEYRERWGRDDFYANIALNQRDGKTFKFVQSTFVDKYTSGATALQFAELIAEVLAEAEDNYGAEESISDYLKMDWADINGDKADDLLIFWKHYKDLSVTAVLSQPSDSLDRAQFFARSEAYVNKFLLNHSISTLDTEDFSGDGISDVILYHSRGSQVILSLATGQWDNNRLWFKVQPDYTTGDTDMSSLRFEKLDSYDANDDGRADYVHAGVLGALSDQKVVSYSFSMPITRKVEK